MNTQPVMNTPSTGTNTRSTNTQAMTVLPPRNPAGSMQNTVRRLGWFSVGLGLAEFFAPRLMSRCVGLAGRERLIASYGIREIATGIGILTASDPRPWIWGRVAGDALDLATLSTATPNGSPRQGSALLAFVAVAGVTAVDVLCGHWLTEFQARRAQPVPDYHGRSGFPHPIEQMRGKARPVASG